MACFSLVFPCIFLQRSASNFSLSPEFENLKLPEKSPKVSEDYAIHNDKVFIYWVIIIEKKFNHDCK